MYSSDLLVTGVASVAIMAGLAAMSMVRAEPQAPPAAGAPQGGRGGRASTPPDANGECPKGTTLVRIGSCQAPEFPAPSIVDYRPKSTLVTEAHLVPKAKFPAIDLHGHPGALVTSADGISKLVTDMDKIGLRVMISADNSSGQALQTRVAAVNEIGRAHV